MMAFGIVMRMLGRQFHNGGSLQQPDTDIEHTKIIQSDVARSCRRFLEQRVSFSGVLSSGDEYAMMRSPRVGSAHSPEAYDILLGISGSGFVIRMNGIPDECVERFGGCLRRSADTAAAVVDRFCDSRCPRTRNTGTGVKFTRRA